jgi:hypothetical protein
MPAAQLQRGDRPVLDDGEQQRLPQLPVGVAEASDRPGWKPNPPSKAAIASSLLNRVRQLAAVTHRPRPSTMRILLLCRCCRAFFLGSVTFELR